MSRKHLGLTAALAVAAALAHVTAAAAAGGLSVTPAVLEQTARSGTTGTVTIANTSGRKLKVTVKARPWRQGRTGTVAADRRRTLSRYGRVTGRSFTLAAGARRTASVTLARVPSRRSLYGSLEVVGRPTKRRKGNNVAYRLIGSLRFNPTAGARRIKLRAGSARVSGRRGGRKLTLQVRNAGNTIDAVAGSVVVSGPRGGRSSGITGVKILPGKRVHLALMSLGGLRAGRYTASVTLTQGGRNRLSVTRHFRIKKS
jgi:hypothetical protein